MGRPTTFIIVEVGKRSVGKDVNNTELAGPWPGQPSRLKKKNKKTNSSECSPLRPGIPFHFQLFCVSTAYSLSGKWTANYAQG